MYIDLGASTTYSDLDVSIILTRAALRFSLVEDGV